MAMMEFNLIGDGSPGLCRCCLSEGCFKDMGTEYTWMNANEVYADMLLECFDISISQHNEGPNGPDRPICEVCITRLRDACNFKKQVLDSEIKFIDMLSKSPIKSKAALIKESQMKVERDETSGEELEYLDDDMDFREDVPSKTTRKLRGSSTKVLTKPVKIKRSQPKKSVVRAKKTKDTMEETANSSKTRLKKNEVFNSTEDLLQEKYFMEISPKDEAEDSNVDFGEIEFLDEDADIVEKSVSAKFDNDEESDGAQRKKRKRNPRHPYRNYSQNDLKKCMEAVKEYGMSKLEASRTYNVPRKTIDSILLSEKKKYDEENDSQDEIEDIKKHRNNIQTILKYTNATPIKDQRTFGYMCYYCPKKYPKPADLKKHTLTHEGLSENYHVKLLSPYTAKLDTTGLECKICMKNIDNFTLEEVMEHLIKHRKVIHTDINNHILPFKFDTDVLKCYLCDESFLCFKLLAMHMSEHYPNYKCKMCDKKFVNKSARRTHSYKHKLGVFPCSTCGKTFSTSLRLREHKRVVHLLENKTRKCCYCSEKFVDVVQKCKHEVYEHGAEPPQFFCTFCDKVFESQRSMSAHTKSSHLMIRRYRCELCGKGFAKKSALQRHLNTHAERIYECEVCTERFNTRKALKTHFTTHYSFN